MPSQMIRLRVATEEVGRWKEYAKDSRMSLSAYIRMCVEEKNEGGLSDRVMRLARQRFEAPLLPVNYDVTVEVGPTPNATRAQYDKAAKRLKNKVATVATCRHGREVGRFCGACGGTAR